MAFGDKEIGKGKASDDECASQVSLSVDGLSDEIDKLNAALANQDKLLRLAARKRKEYMAKLEVALKELEIAKSAPTIFDEVECDICAIHMSNFASLQTKYATLLDELDEVKARPMLLGACKLCSGLQSELAEKNKKISMLEMASSGSMGNGRCALCEDLELELESCRRDKMRSEEDNTYLRTILSWVSCNEPQLGMMMTQLRRGIGGPGIGFSSDGKGANLFGKIGECSGLKPSEKPISTSILTKTILPKPLEPIVKDGVVEESPKAPPQKQLWIPKPNHLRNPLDTLSDIPEDPLPKAKQPIKVNHTHQRENKPPKREARYHCEYCKRDGHLVEFCFRQKRDERREYELNNRDMYHPFHGVDVPPV